MAGSYEVGSGHFAVIPSFRGFRKATVAEANAAGEDASRGFSRAMGRGGDVAGGLAGRGFAQGFSRSASVSTALRMVEKEVRVAAANVAKLRLQEADAAGRVRVAEASLADARSRYAADSVQVVRAEERLASAQRAHESVSTSLRAATERLTQAQRTLQSALGGASKAGGFFAQLKTDLEPLRGHMQAAAAQVGVFYRNSMLLAPVRGVVSGISSAWTRVSGVVSGLGPVVLRPLGQQFARLGSQAVSWTRNAIAQIPGVGRAVSAVSSGIGRVGSLFGAAGTAATNMARTVLSAVAPVGGRIASALGTGFQQAVSLAGRAAASIASAFQSALGAIATGAVAGLVASLKGGFDRLSSVETATAKMRGFGIAAEQVNVVMADVKNAVQGTIYTVGDMGNAAAQALIAGIKPGEQLNRYMAFLKNTATAANAPLSEIGSIMGKIVANVGGPVTTELQQLADRGIPVWTQLSESMGVSVQRLKEMASEGEITADVIVEHLGGSLAAMAEEVGSTTESSLLRMRSASSRFGEALMQESFPGVKAIADAVRAVMDMIIALLPSLKEAFGFDQIGPGIERINSFTEKVREFTALITGGSAEGQTALSGIVSKVQELAPLLGLAAAAAIPLMGTFLSGLPVIGGLFAGLGPGLIGGLAPILAGGGIIAMLGMNPESFAGMITGLVSTVVSGLGSLVSSVTSVLSTLVPTIVSNLTANAPVLAQGFMDLLLGLGQAAATLIPVLVNAVIQLIPALISALASMLPQLIQGGIQLLLGIVQGLVSAIPQLVTALVGAIPLLITALVSAIPLLMQGALQLFLGLVQGLVAALPEIITAVVEAIPLIITALVEQLPAMVTGAIELFLGVIMGLLEALPQIITALINAIPQIILALVSALPQMITGAIELFLGIVTGLIKAIPDIITAVIDMIPQIISALIDAIPQIIDAGWQLIQGLVKGIIDAGSMVFDAIGDIVNGAIGWAKDLLGIASPSKVFRTIGDQTGQGLALGLDGSRSSVESAAGRLVDATRDAFAGLENEVFEVPVTAAALQSAGVSVSAAGRSGSVSRAPIVVSLEGATLRASLDGKPITLLIEEQVAEAVAPAAPAALSDLLGTSWR